MFRPSVVFAKDRQPCVFFLLHVWRSPDAAWQYSSVVVGRKVWGRGIFWPIIFSVASAEVVEFHIKFCAGVKRRRRAQILGGGGLDQIENKNRSAARSTTNKAAQRAK